jgi:hypothetical protein
MLSLVGLEGFEPWWLMDGRRIEFEVLKKGLARY